MKLDQKSILSAGLGTLFGLLVATTAGAEDPKPVEVGYKNAITIDVPAAQAKLKIGGRIQADWAAISADDDLRNALINNPPNDPPNTDPNGVGVEFRRARLYVSGVFYDRIIFKAQYDFVGEETKFKDLYIGMKNLGPVGTIKLGHFKEPFSLEELASTKYMTFMERALPSVFDSARNFGLGAQNNHLDGRLNWALGIFADTNDQGFTFENGTKMNLTGRLTGLPYVNEDGDRLLHLGVSLSHHFRDATTASFSQGPEVHLSQKFLNLEDFMSDGNTLMAAELAYVCGPFSLQGEYKPEWIQQPGGGIDMVHGGYAYVSYFLTGESRQYKRSSAAFTRVNPTNAFNPAEGKWGAWEVAARYSFLDLNDGVLDGGEEQNATFGINWYLFSNVRLTANYVFGDVKDTGAALGHASGRLHAFQMRTQLEF